MLGHDLLLIFFLDLFSFIFISGFYLICKLRISEVFCSMFVYRCERERLVGGGGGGGWGGGGVGGGERWGVC